MLEEEEVLQEKRDRTLSSKPTKPQRVVVTVNDDGHNNGPIVNVNVNHIHEPAPLYDDCVRKVIITLL